MDIKIHREEGAIGWDLVIDGEFVTSAFDFNRVAGRAIRAIAADGEDWATVNIQVVDDESIVKRLARKNREILSQPIFGQD